MTPSIILFIAFLIIKPEKKVKEHYHRSCLDFDWLLSRVIKINNNKLYYISLIKYLILLSPDLYLLVFQLFCLFLTYIYIFCYLTEAEIIDFSDKFWVKFNENELETLKNLQFVQSTDFARDNHHSRCLLVWPNYFSQLHKLAHFCIDDFRCYPYSWRRRLQLGMATWSRMEMVRFFQIRKQ